MADDILITPGAGARVSTDERTIGGVAAQVQRVNDIGASAIALARASATSTAAQIVAARDTRKRVTLHADPANGPTEKVYVGTSSVSAGSLSANAFPLAPGATLVLHTSAAIWADSEGGQTQLIWIIEEYDA